MAVHRLKVMWDYAAFPVWSLDEEWQASVENIAISPDLRRDLQTWSDDLTDSQWGAYGPDDPKTKSPSAEMVREWDKRGRALAARLQAELGENFEIVYFSEETGTVE